jgi:metallophosphoesterase (TIGR00282 family)
MIGDVVGRAGRRAVTHVLPSLRQELDVDFVVANGENSAAGRGTTRKTVEELLDAGVDVVSGGNHTFANKDIIPCLDRPDYPALRPLNYPPGVPGRGVIRRGNVAVINLIGRAFMPSQYDDFFRAVDDALEQIEARVVLVDFHAEATSEKVGLGWYLDGRVSAVVGTHTHVPTADNRVLPQGTAYVSDLGMCGAQHSVIGDEVDAVLERLQTQMPTRLPAAEGPEAFFNSVLIEVDDATGRASSIVRVDRECVPYDK